MKHLPTTLVLASCFGLVTAAQAQVQVSVGPRVGGTLCSRFTASNSTGYRFGLVAGAQASLSWKKFALQPALLFEQKGGLTSEESTSYPAIYSPGQLGLFPTQYRLNYLTLPLNVAFTPAGPGTGPQFFAGPYLGVLLGGEGSYSLRNEADKTAPIYVAAYEDPAKEGHAVRRFDAGVQAGVGYRCKRLLLRAEYSLSLVNQAPYYGDSPLTPPNVYNREFQTSVSYLFDLKR
ncbi:MAG: porin family protein [Janthinobacterium lividum]